MTTKTIPRCLCGLVAVLAACSSGAPKPATTGPGQPEPGSTGTAGAPAAAPAAAMGGPAELAIGDLVVDKERTVRIKGMISAIVGMRLVPPKVIFKVTDNTGTVTAVINEQAQLSEGTKVELVGTYDSVPSPTYDGPGEAPREDIFVVERHLDLP
jgi:hypothetical protein